MLLRYKTFKQKIPAKYGNKPIKSSIPFNIEDERKSMLLMLGIDPTLSDEELEDYTTSFAPTFSDILEDNSNDMSVLDYIKSEILVKQSEIEKINEVFAEDYKEELERWEQGSVAVKTLYLPNDNEEANALIESFENSELFIEWLDSYEIDEIDDSVKGVTELDAFRVGDKIVVAPKNESNKVVISQLAKDNNLEYSVIDISSVDIEDDNVLSVYQFYAYLDRMKDKNILESIVDMVVDRDKTELENKELVPNSEQLPLFAGKTRVESFSPDDVFRQINNL